MATFNEIRTKIAAMSELVRSSAPTIIAETATEYFKERFSTKEWDGAPWQPTKNPPGRGSTLLRDRALFNSIHPTRVSDQEVVISAGGINAPYAQIHNEGGTIKHPGGTAWRMVPEGDEGKLKPVWVSNKKAGSTNLKRTKAHNIPIPQRQFMGHSEKLNKIILTRLEALARSATK